MEKYKRVNEICVPFKSDILINKIEDNVGPYPLYGAKGLQKGIDYYQQKNPYISIIKWGAGVGRVNIHEGKSSIVATMQGILPSEGIDIRWLYYALLSLDLGRYATNTTVPNLYFKDYGKAKVFTPSFEEQQHIASILTKTEYLIKLYQKQLSSADELIKSRFVELFGDPVTNPNEYPVHPLSEFIDFLTSGSRGWAKYCVDDGDEWFITIKNVKDCHISLDNMQPINAPDNAEAKRTRVKEGDLLISITADLGRTGIVTKEIADHGAYINQHLTCIRLNRDLVEPLYVAYFMESSAGKEQFDAKNQNAVKSGLNFNSINTLQLLVPPKSLQLEFLDFIAQIDKSKAVIQKSLDEAQLLFDSLMQEYFE